MNASPVKSRSLNRACVLRDGNRIFVGLNHFMYKSTPTDYSQATPGEWAKEVNHGNKMNRR